MCQFRPVCSVCGFGYSTIPEAEACEAAHKTAADQPFSDGQLAEGLIVRHGGRFFELRAPVAAQVIYGKVDKHPLDPGAVRFGHLRGAVMREVPDASGLDVTDLGEDLMLAAVKLSYAARRERALPPVLFGAVLYWLDLIALRAGFDLGECVREYFDSKKKAAA